MDSSKLVHKGLEFQYEVNKELARQLGVYDQATFPSLESLAPNADEAMGPSSALVIAHSEVNDIMSEPNDNKLPIVDRYNNLDSDFCELHVVEEQKRPHNFISPRRPYQVGVVKNGLAEESSADFHNLSFYTQSQAAQEYSGMRPMDISDYLALSALRNIYGLPALKDRIRTLDCAPEGLPHVATASTIGGTDVIALRNAPATMRSLYLGIRLITSIACDSK